MFFPKNTKLCFQSLNGASYNEESNKLTGAVKSDDDETILQESDLFHEGSHGDRGTNYSPFCASGYTKYQADDEAIEISGRAGFIKQTFNHDNER